MKKLKLSKLKVKDLEGNEQLFDVSKSFANYLYKATGDLGMLKAAQTLYEKGEVELEDNQVAEVTTLVNHDKNCTFIAIVKQEILKQLEK